MSWERREPYVETAAWRALKPVVRRRSGGRCEHRDNSRCRRPGHQVDHIHPKSLGGPDTLDNAQHLCFEHHQEKTQREAASARAAQAAKARYPVRKHPGLK